MHNDPCYGKIFHFRNRTIKTVSSPANKQMAIANIEGSNRELNWHYLRSAGLEGEKDQSNLVSVSLRLLSSRETHMFAWPKAVELINRTIRLRVFVFRCYIFVMFGELACWNIVIRYVREVCWSENWMIELKSSKKSWDIFGKISRWVMSNRSQMEDNI